MTIHRLKTAPAYFDAIAAGDKTFEIRWDDRCFQRGDQLVLREWDDQLECACRETRAHHLADCPRYTGREISASVGVVIAHTTTTGHRLGFDGRGYVVMSLLDVGAVELRTRPQPTGGTTTGTTAAGIARVAAARGATRPGDRLTVAKPPRVDIAHDRSQP